VGCAESSFQTPSLLAALDAKGLFKYPAGQEASEGGFILPSWAFQNMATRSADNSEVAIPFFTMIAAKGVSSGCFLRNCDRAASVKTGPILGPLSVNIGKRSAWRD
jgi:hypothetical protein